MKRKSFIKTAALGLGAAFHMPFTGERYPAEEVFSAFKDDADPDFMYDVLIVGGSYAGLSAALGLGRCRRTVLVIDEGLPRNRTSPQANNLFSRDGQDPAEIREIAGSQLKQYQKYLSRTGGIITGIEIKDDTFALSHADGRIFTARNVVLASGVTDNLQAIDGLDELWGRGVYHCPYCHGWENRDKKTVVIGIGTTALSLASTVSNWTDDITYYSQGIELELPDEAIQTLTNNGITAYNEIVSKIEKSGTGVRITLEGSNEPIYFEACYAPGRITANSGLAESLGCELQPNGGIVVNEQYMSHTDGLYAIGDVCSRSNGQVIHAAYSGTVVAAAINRAFLSQKFS